MTYLFSRQMTFPKNGFTKSFLHLPLRSFKRYGSCELAEDQVLCHYVTLQGLKNTDREKNVDLEWE